MSVHNIVSEIRSALAIPALTKALTATLTVKELLDNFRINADAASTTIVLTLPAASEATKGCINIITCAGVAAATIICTEGWGGGSSYTTVTLAQGESVIIYSDADDWYQLSNEPATT